MLCVCVSLGPIHLAPVAEPSLRRGHAGQAGTSAKQTAAPVGPADMGFSISFVQSGAPGGSSCLLVALTAKRDPTVWLKGSLRALGIGSAFLAALSVFPEDSLFKRVHPGPDSFLVSRTPSQGCVSRGSSATFPGHL